MHVTRPIIVRVERVHRLTQFDSDNELLDPAFRVTDHRTMDLSYD